MKKTTIQLKKQLIHFNKNIHQSYALIIHDDFKHYLCFNYPMVSLISENEQNIIFNKAHFPTSEDIRILNKAQAILSGIHYSPLFVSDNQMIVHAQIDDYLHSQQILMLSIVLNTKGYFEISHVTEL